MWWVKVILIRGLRSTMATVFSSCLLGRCDENVERMYQFPADVCELPRSLGTLRPGKCLRYYATALVAFPSYKSQMKFVSV